MNSLSRNILRANSDVSRYIPQILLNYIMLWGFMAVLVIFNWIWNSCCSQWEWQGRMIYILP